MKLSKFFRVSLFTTGAVLASIPNAVFAELLEQDFTQITHNKSTQRGMPLSHIKQDPRGSDGNAPAGGTPGQFRGFMPFGSSAKPIITQRDDLSTGQSYFQNAANIGLPRSNRYVLSRASIGAPMHGRKVNFLFGQIIGKPSSIGTGQDKVLIGSPSTFWADEPFIPTLKVTAASELKGLATITTETDHDLLRGDIVVVDGVKGIAASNLTVLETTGTTFKVLSSIDSTGQVLDALNAAADDSVLSVVSKSMTVDAAATMRKAHESLGYYYSPHGKCVVSIQPGPVKTTWRERSSLGGTPNGVKNEDWTEINGVNYKLHEVEYIVSATAYKAPQFIYWNKQPIYDGPLVVLPDGLGELKIVFSKIFQERVSSDEAIHLLETGTGQSAEVELRTLWVNQISPKLRVLNAFNTTGRVIVELLGNPRSDGTRQHLGFEIVDVLGSSVPDDVVLDLGDRVLPHDDGAAVNDESIFPDLRDRGDTGSGGFAIKKPLPGTQQMAYYAIKETKHLNDLVAFWLRESVAGVAWPVYHNRYQLQWPVDSSRYSHYLRPQVGRADAIETAVTLPPENSTAIFYQDRDSLGNNRATIDGMQFYSWLDTDYPTHRTLLGHETVKGGMAFEHVLSWLDTSVKDDDNWPKTEQITHLSLWPKIKVAGNHGVPTRAQGGITARLYVNIDNSDGKIVNLMQSGQLSQKPDEEVTMNTFEWENNSGDNYATHFLGYFHPPTTGYYTFAIASDDQGALYLSTDANRGNVELVSRQLDRAESREYEKAQLSSTKYLESGKAYFIESFHVESSSDDHLSVAFEFSETAGTHSNVPNDTSPIKGELLSPWSSNNDLREGITVQPLQYPFEIGQTVEFLNGSTFTFTRPARMGDAMIHGSLAGRVLDGQAGIQPSISVPPRVQVPMPGGYEVTAQLTPSVYQKVSKGGTATDPVDGGSWDLGGPYYVRERKESDPDNPVKTQLFFGFDLSGIDPDKSIYVPLNSSFTKSVKEMIKTLRITPAICGCHE